MTGAQLLDAQVQEKRRYALLSELFDLTRQLAEAVDRSDEVTIQMLLSMREEPLAQMRQVEENLIRQRAALAEEDGRRLEELLSGAPARRQTGPLACFLRRRKPASRSSAVSVDRWPSTPPFSRTSPPAEARAQR